MYISYDHVTYGSDESRLTAWQNLTLILLAGGFCVAMYAASGAIYIARGVDLVMTLPEFVRTKIRGNK